MLIKMKETTKVSTTGLNKLIWEEGSIHDAPKDLAISLVKGGLAKSKPGEGMPDETQNIDPDETQDTDSDETGGVDPDETGGVDPNENA